MPVSRIAHSLAANCYDSTSSGISRYRAVERQKLQGAFLMREGDQKVVGSTAQEPRTELGIPQVKGDPDLWSIAYTLAQAQEAGAFVTMSAVSQFTSISLKFGERTFAALLEATSGPGKPDGRSINGVANEMMSLHRAYVRELSALPGLVGMSYFEHLDQIRRRSPSVKVEGSK
jgi:hypothetical protein